MLPGRLSQSFSLLLSLAVVATTAGGATAAGAQPDCEPARGYSALATWWERCSAADAAEHLRPRSCENFVRALERQVAFESCPESGGNRLRELGLCGPAESPPEACLRAYVGTLAAQQSLAARRLMGSRDFMTALSPRIAAEFSRAHERATEWLDDLGVLPFASSPPGEELPLDEALGVPDLVAFRGAVLAAVRNRDTATLRSLMHERIQLGFGGAYGWESFEAQWQPEDRDSEVWSSLEFILSNGGLLHQVGEGTSFRAPSFARLLPGGLDSFVWGVIASRGQKLYVEPDLDSTVVRVLGREFVKAPRRLLSASEEPDPDGWTRIEAVDGATGYVPFGAFRSPVGLRVGMTRTPEGWRITSLLSGD